MFFFFINPILIAAAIIPAVVLLLYVYRADRLEKEPGSLLLSLVIQGVIATVLAMLTERLGMWLLPMVFPEGTLSYNAALYFVVVAVSEEGFKYFLLRKKTWNCESFNCQFDGVVYAVFVSLGFALWENISYVMMYGLGTAMVRAVTAVPGHACFGVFMGAWYGLAKRYEYCGDTQKSKNCRILALLLPAFMHGSYDFIAAMQTQNYAWLFVAFVAVMFIVAFRLVKKLARTDQYINRKKNKKRI